MPYLSCHIYQHRAPSCKMTVAQQNNTKVSNMHLQNQTTHPPQNDEKIIAKTITRSQLWN